MIRKITGLILCSIVAFSLIGCEIKDEYIIVRKDNSEEKPSGDKVNEIFDTEKMQDLMDKLKSAPEEFLGKIDEVNTDSTSVLEELEDKAEDLNDALNNADIQGEREDVKNQISDISKKVEELKSNVEEIKDRTGIENPIDEIKIKDTIDELKNYINKLQKSLDRVTPSN